MANTTKSVLWRLLRGSIALVIAGGIAYTKNDVKLIAFAPVINAGAKWLRSIFKIKWLPL